MESPWASNSLELRLQSMRWLPGCGWLESGVVSRPLAGVAGSCAAEAAQASKAVAVASGSGGDGHSLVAEEVAHGSRCGGSHGGVLWEGAEDGSGQGHHHGGGLDDNGGVLAAPDTGLIAAVGQRGGATVSQWQAAVVAGHVSGLEVHLGERAGKKQSTRADEEQPG